MFTNKDMNRAISDTIQSIHLLAHISSSPNNEIASFQRWLSRGASYVNCM